MGGDNIIDGGYSAVENFNPHLRMGGDVIKNKKLDSNKSNFNPHLRMGGDYNFIS